MPYRPQFFFTTPSGYRDVPYVRPVIGDEDQSGSSTGNLVSNYIIQLDKDADQIFHSLFIQGPNQGQAEDFMIQLRDSWGNFITDGFVPLSLYAWGAGETPEDGGSGRAKVFESELYCPRGSVLIADFWNGGASFLFPPFMEFRGIKRFKGACA